MDSAFALLPTRTATPPRLLVVGLLDRQFALLREEFPSLNLEHVSSGHTNTFADVAAKQRNAHRVFMVTKFVSHSMFYGIDREKLVYCTGLDSVRKHLCDYAADFAFANVPSNVLRFPSPIADMSAPMCDYSPFESAKTGDVLTFNRPDGIPAHLFAQNLEAARMRYRAKLGILSTQEISGGRAEVLILLARPALLAAEAALIEPYDDVTYRVPSIEEDARTFWRDVYVASFRALPYGNASIHSHMANVGVAAFLAMCGFDYKGE